MAGACIAHACSMKTPKKPMKDKKANWGLSVVSAALVPCLHPDSLVPRPSNARGERVMEKIIE